MLIGELAERAGTSTRTLRYYEQHGLVLARRSPNGYRVYDEAELRVVHEIRTLLAVGFGLDDIRPFVECLRAGNRSGDVCPDSVAVLRRKLAEVDAIIERMSAVRDQLSSQLAEAIAQREERRCAPSPTDSFAEEVVASAKPVVVDFWAEWCPSCKRLAPTLAELADEYGDRVEVVKINADENPQTVRAYGVLSLPTLVVFRDGEPVGALVGARPKTALREALSAFTDR